MKPQLRKELRLLFPAWCAALLLVALPFHWRPALANIAAYVFALLLLGVTPFGREFSCRTFPLLLAQPTSRDLLWRCKKRALDAATLSVWLVFWVSFSSAHGFSVWVGAGSAVAALAIVSTGMWATLLFRQTMPAFCFSLLVPAALGPVIWQMVEAGVPAWVVAIGLPLLAGYGIAASWFARWLFLHAQDLEAWRTDLSLSFFRGEQSAGFPEPGQRRPGLHPFRNLAGKEIHLHQVNLISGVFLFLMLGLAAVLFAGTQGKEGFAGVQIAFGLACLFMPVLAGSVAIAEERKLGTLEAQQGLPVSRIRQFFLKLGAAYGVAFLLALALPLFVSAAVAWIAEASLIEGDAMRWIKFLGGYAVAAGAVALYASSLSRSTLGALILTLVGLFAAFFLGLGLHAIWRGFPLMMWVGVPVGVFVLLLLSFRNFREDLIDSRVRWQNVRVLAGSAAAVFLLTVLVHNRTWEFVLPEPRLGPPEPALADGAEISWASGGRFVVHLPDGRLWLSEQPWRSEEPFAFPASGTFLREENWVKVAAGRGELWGIKEDGSLWRISEDDGGEEHTFEPVGEGARWTDLAGRGNHFLGVRDDGTLWGWGKIPLDRRGWRDNLSAWHVREPSTEPVEGAPVRIAPQSNWAKVFATGDLRVGVQRDGSTWYWVVDQRPAVARRPRSWDRLPGENVVEVAGHSAFSVALLADDTLWASGRNLDQSGSSEPLRLGDRSDWKSVAVRGWESAIVALRRDGTLWGANLRNHPDDTVRPAEPTRKLSDHAGWVAVTGDDSFFALANDGTWWEWEQPFEDDSPSLLDPSRRPRRVGE